jgi:hypothetical protein
MPFTPEVVLKIALTPTARSAAIDVTEESYDVTTALNAYADVVGSPPLVLKVGDLVSVSTPAVFNTHVGVVGARVVDATHIAVQWGNFTAAANVPPAGTYLFRVSRA